MIRRPAMRNILHATKSDNLTEEENRAEEPRGAETRARRRDREEQTVKNEQISIHL